MSWSEDYILGRGLSLEVVSSHGVEIDADPERGLVEQRLGKGCPPLWEIAKEIIWFPISSAYGEVSSWVAYPLPTLDRSPKFIAPVDSTNPPFISPDTHTIAADPAVPIIITDEPFKVLACSVAGINAIGLNGVWAASEKTLQEQLVLRSELRDFDLRGRRVYMCFDSDADVNPETRCASIRLFLLLSSAGANVYQLVSWDISQGKGIDDFLVQSIKDDPSTTAPDQLSMLTKDAALFIDTIQPNKVDLDFVIAELVKVQLSDAHQAQICRELAKHLKVPSSTLRKVVQEKSEDIDHALRFGMIPDPWPDPVNGANLLSDLSAVLSRHLVMSEYSRTATALWVLLTYLTGEVDVLPILGVTSPVKRCGKTRLLTILEWLVHKPLPASNISTAAVYRVIEQWSPTLIIDEGDTFLKHNDELRGILNSGHQRALAFVLRSSSSGHVERFST
jgi:hypothetical protein